MDTQRTASYVTTTKGGAGFFAVEVWFNPEGFWEPWETGIGRYATNAEAEVEGREWAKDMQLEFKPSSMPALEAMTDTKLIELANRLREGRLEKPEFIATEHGVTTQLQLDASTAILSLIEQLQKAREEALEEAAKHVEGVYWRSTRDELAASIRALKSPPQPTKETK